MEFFIPKAEIIFEEEIKKSRFITHIRHTAGIEQARAFWAEMRLLHPKARHHCWATVAGSPKDSLLYGFSDDGEPSGTAGKTILNYLVGSELGEISAVVIRYYGGILLGTGGLVKAYGNGVQQALQQLEKVRKVVRESYRLVCTYEQFNHVQYLISRSDIHIVNQQFHHNITLTLAIAPEQLIPIQEELTQKFHGTITLSKI